MKYVEFCKLCLSRPGKLKTKFDLNVLCIFSYVAFFKLVPIGTDTLYKFQSEQTKFFSSKFSLPKRPFIQKKITKKDLSQKKLFTRFLHFFLPFSRYGPLLEGYAILIKLDIMDNIQLFIKYVLACTLSMVYILKLILHNVSSYYL